MLVSPNDYLSVIDYLKSEGILALDTETTGLRPYHGDKPFSVIIANRVEAFYFNFNKIDEAPPLDPKVLGELFELPDMRWVLHNAKFDMAQLMQLGLRLNGIIYDLWVADRIWNNQHLDYSLDQVAYRWGHKKSDTVKKYIIDHKLFEKKKYPHFNKTRTDYFFDRVPLNVIRPYAENDALITYHIFEKLTNKLVERDQLSPVGRPSCRTILGQEARLTDTLFAMEDLGVKIDREYCQDAVEYFTKEIEKTKEEFKKITGEEFRKGTILFKELFKDEDITYTEKGNPSFDATAMASFKHPAARCVMDYSRAKKTVEYFQGFLYHADHEDLIHTDFCQAGTTTGRLSSRSPNLQNLTKPDRYEEDTAKYPVRSAFIPREGFFFAMLDYSQMEYRLMLDMAKADGLIDEVLNGLDVHEATAKIAGVSRSDAKTVNFLTLYGGGVKKLAADLGCSESKARQIQQSIFKAAPEVVNFIRSVIHRAKTRGYVFNQYGRRYYFDDRNFAYKAPNHLIQGTCADIMKKAMIECEDYLEAYESKMILSIHDELIFEVKHGEEEVILKLKDIMERVYQPRRLPMAVDAEWGYNLADKNPLDSLEYFHGVQTGDSTKEQNNAPSKEAAPLMGMQDPAIVEERDPRHSNVPIGVIRGH